MTATATKPEVQEEVGLSNRFLSDMTDSFRAYMKHMVNPTLKGLTEYLRDEISCYAERPKGRKQWVEFEQSIGHMWANRPR